MTWWPPRQLPESVRELQRTVLGSSQALVRADPGGSHAHLDRSLDELVERRVPTRNQPLLDSVLRVGTTPVILLA